MCAELGLEVVNLHRVGFAGVGLRGCERAGDWAHLAPDELRALGLGK